MNKEDYEAVFKQVEQINKEIDELEKRKADYDTHQTGLARLTALAKDSKADLSKEIQERRQFIAKLETPYQLDEKIKKLRQTIETIVKQLYSEPIEDESLEVSSVTFYEDRRGYVIMKRFIEGKEKWLLYLAKFEPTEMAIPCTIETDKEGKPCRITRMVQSSDTYGLPVLHTQDIIIDKKPVQEPTVENLNKQAGLGKQEWYEKKIEYQIIEKEVWFCLTCHTKNSVDYLACTKCGRLRLQEPIIKRK